MLVHADALRIAPREQGGTGGCADRGGHHEAGELTPLLSNTVDIWGIDCLGAEATEVAVALVICEDNDEVGFRRIEGSRDKKENGQSQKRKKVLVFYEDGFVVLVDGLVQPSKSGDNFTFSTEKSGNWTVEK